MKRQRDTRQRRLVLEAVRARRDHPTADQLYLDVRQREETVSRGTVYRNLKLLSETGVIARIPMESADRFDLREEPHDHLHCSGCGAVCDIPFPYQAERDQALAKATGYQIDRHHTVYEGLCPACQSKMKKGEKE